ncbi:hypothetical protein HYZ41_04815 [archaeon]|nr:hypothetical protein [archaeon]
MKGQYKIVLEVMFILVGIFITSYVVMTFGSLNKSIDVITVEDNFNAVANNVVVSVLKVAENDNSISRFTVPDKISSHVYKVVLDSENSRIYVISMKDSTVNVTRQIFNITSDRIVTSEVISSSVNIEAVNEGGIIRIRRPA